MGGHGVVLAESNHDEMIGGHGHEPIDRQDAKQSLTRAHLTPVRVCSETSQVAHNTFAVAATTPVGTEITIRLP